MQPVVSLLIVIGLLFDARSLIKINIQIQTFLSFFTRFLGHSPGQGKLTEQIIGVCWFLPLKLCQKILRFNF